MKITRKEQEFQTTDWYGYAGAVSKNGQEPLIAQFNEEETDTSIDLLISYSEPDDNDESCRVDLNIFVGDDENYGYCICYNWDIAYELFKAVYKELSMRSAEETIKSLKNKGFTFDK